MEETKVAFKRKELVKLYIETFKEDMNFDYESGEEDITALKEEISKRGETHDFMFGCMEEAFGIFITGCRKAFDEHKEDK